MEKTLHYSIMPEYIMKDSRLSSSSKVLYCKIVSLSHQKGFCWATNSYFAEYFETGLNSIKRWLKELEDLNYIRREVVYEDNTKQIHERKIYVVDEEVIAGIKNDPTGRLKNDPTAGIKNDPDNNININNINNNIKYDEDGFSSPVLAASSQKDIETNVPSAQPVKEPAYYKCRPTPPEGITDDTTPYSTEKYPYVFLSRNDRGFLRWKYDKCYIPTLHALNEWNKLNPEFKYSSNKDGFERFVAKQGLRRPREDGLSEGSVIARI